MQLVHRRVPKFCAIAIFLFRELEFGIDFGEVRETDALHVLAVFVTSELSVTRELKGSRMKWRSYENKPRVVPPRMPSSSLAWPRRTSGGFFRSLLPVVKPDKAARQTLPSLGKPHPSGPTLQGTG